MAGTWRIEVRDAVTSTNDEARRLAEGGDPGRLAVRARVQTGGRGRHGRSWASDPGGLYLSALLRPTLPPSRLGLLPLAAGVAMAEVVEGLGLAPELKWPNDAVLGGRKVGGVLCESRLLPAGDGVRWAIVGMGLNVAQPARGLEAVGGIALAEAAGRPLAPEDLAGPLLAALDRGVAWAEARPGDLLAAWSRRAPMLGRAVRVATAAGERTGTAERVDASGALVVATADGPLVVTDVHRLRTVA